MTRVPQYPDVFRHRTASVLPPELQKAARDLGLAFQRQQVSADLAVAFRRATHSVPAAAVPRGIDEIIGIAQIGHGFGRAFPIRHRAETLTVLGLKRPTGETVFHDMPDLTWFLMLHGNGYVREAALKAMTGAPQSAFEVTALVYRLNDWVPNVRKAALAAATRAFPRTDPTHLANSALFLLPQMRQFRRWDAEAHDMVRDSLHRPEVLSILYEIIRTSSGGGVGLGLRHLLQRPGFDAALAGLARDAHLPTVRAVAFETLLTGRARWLTGYRREWIDKIYGLRRRVAEFGTRDITLTDPVDGVLFCAARDRSSLVRRLAADYLIAHRNDLSVQMRDLAAELSHDPSPAVTSRIAFLY